MKVKEITKIIENFEINFLKEHKVKLTTLTAETIETPKCNYTHVLLMSEKSQVCSILIIDNENNFHIVTPKNGYDSNDLVDFLSMEEGNDLLLIDCTNCNYNIDVAYDVCTPLGMEEEQRKKFYKELKRFKEQMSWGLV